MSRVPLAGRMVMALEMSLGMVQRPELQMRLAPRMIQSMEILQLPIMALQERIQQELQENPVLELKEENEDEATPEETPPAAELDTTKATEGELQAGDDLDFDRLDALSRDWEDHFNEEHRPSRSGLDEEGDKKHDAMQNMPSRPQSLHDYLGDQIGFLDVPEELLQIVRFLITHVDAKGFMPLPLEEVAQSYQNVYGEPVTVAQVEAALGVLQKLDPPGVGARNLEECLMLQVTNETAH